MDKQKQDNQLKPTYSSSVRIQDVAPRTYQKWWTIGRSGERRSGISVLEARHDDDYKPIPDNTEFTFMKKNYFAFSKQIPFIY